MLNFLLRKPNNPYNTFYSATSGTSIVTAEYVYDPIQYITSGGFEGNIYPFYFMDPATGLTATGTTCTAVSSTEAAVAGKKSAKVVLVNNAHYFVVDIFKDTSDGADITTKTLTIKAYAKTSSAGCAFFTSVGGSGGSHGTVTGGSQVITADGAWHSYTFTAVVTINGLTEHIWIGLTSSTPSATVYLDEVYAYCAVNLSTTAISTKLNMSGTEASSIVTAGSTMVFLAGPAAKYGALIESKSGSTITLVEALPILPEVGNKYIAFSKNTTYLDSFTQIVQLNEYVSSGNFTSAIDGGYKQCTLELSTKLISGRMLSYDVTGWDLLVAGDEGTAWNGVVSSMTIDENVISITAVGYLSLVETLPYAGYFEILDETTTPYVIGSLIGEYGIIRDVDGSLDRGDIMDTAQQSYGGIGPLDFTEPGATAKTVIDKVMALGPFDATGDDIWFQIWNERVPEIKRVVRPAQAGEVNWILDASDIIGSEVSQYTKDRTKVFNIWSANYRGDSGEQLTSANIYSLRDLLDYGPQHGVINNGSLSDGEIGIVLDQKIQDLQEFLSVSSISISGMVRSNSAAFSRSVYNMRAGDVVMLSRSVEGMADLGSSVTDGIYIVIGETDYNIADDTVSITPYTYSDRVENVISLLDITVGE